MVYCKGNAMRSCLIRGLSLNSNHQRPHHDDILVEHAKFPFPHPVEDESFGTTDIPDLEVGLLARE